MAALGGRGFVEKTALIRDKIICLGFDLSQGSWFGNCLSRGLPVHENKFRRSTSVYECTGGFDVSEIAGNLCKEGNVRIFFLTNFSTQWE